MARQVSPQARARLKAHEALRLRAYMPTPQDRPTIGYGQTFNPDGSPVRMGQVWTAEEAERNFSTAMANLARNVENALAGAPTTQNQFDALCSLAYNIGIANFAKSTVLKRHRAGDYAGAAAHFIDWRFQKGRVLPGLVRRRNEEAAVYRQ